MSKDNFRYGMSRILMTNERDPDRISLKIYGIYAVYIPGVNQFKLGYGVPWKRLCNYRITEPDARLIAFTPIEERKAAQVAERIMLRDTAIYNPNGNKQSEMRLNIKPVREYIKKYFDEVYDEGIL